MLKHNGGQFCGAVCASPEAARLGYGKWPIDELFGIGADDPNAEVERVIVVDGIPRADRPAVGIGQGLDEYLCLSCSRQRNGEVFLYDIAHGGFVRLAPSFTEFLDQLEIDPEANYPTEARAEPWKAAERGDIAAVSATLAAGFDINAVDRQEPRRATLLMIAASCCRLALAQFLVSHGANIHARDKIGWQAIHYAAHYGRSVDLMELLVHHGADVNAVAKNGDTPLHWVAGFLGGVRVFAWLLEHGGDALLQNRSQKTPVDMLESGKVDNPGLESVWGPCLQLLASKGIHPTPKRKR